MRNVCSEILLTAFVVFDLRYVINDNYVEFFIAEKLRIGLGRSSDYLDLIDPAVIYIVNSYEIYTVL